MAYLVCYKNLLLIFSIPLSPALSTALIAARNSALLLVAPSSVGIV